MNKSGICMSALVLSMNMAMAGDWLVKWKDQGKAAFLQDKATKEARVIEDFESIGWSRVEMPKKLIRDPRIAYIQPNYPISLMPMPGLSDAKKHWEKMLKQKPQHVHSWLASQKAEHKVLAADPRLPGPVREGKGADPKFDQQWGMLDIGVKKAWERGGNQKEIVVAVIDTGVDYTHEDLVSNMWQNPGEVGQDAQGRDKSSNGVDDDRNGFIDDVVGWDFVQNDALPYDITVPVYEIITKGGNPGHGTHCAGNVGARGNNQKGIAGVAPQIKIMALRFLSEKGQGTTADGVKAVEYAVKNGAKVLSNSWGSEGEDEQDGEGNRALREAIQYAEDQGAIFVAAAGNGHQGRGYDNDRDAKPAYPASYDHDIIVSVAALNAQNQLGPFSNWGKTSVDLGAPGVKIFSTVPSQKYQDTVLDFLGMKVTWDGTSMATPHVAGALALYWSAHPEKSWREVKEALMQSVVPVADLGPKTVSGGKLNVEKLLE
jgi:thermitase